MPIFICNNSGNKYEEPDNVDESNLCDGKLSERYYRNQDAHINKAYEIGRDFEYRIMSFLFADGWHVMRRFGSQGVRFCNKCHRHVPRNQTKCFRCKTDKYVMKASLDLTAYKDGVYMLITCKYSTKRATVYLDDAIWANLVQYARHYGAIPVFAGINTDRSIYFVNLENLKQLDFIGFQDETLKSIMEGEYKQKIVRKPDKSMVDWLLEEAKSVVEECNARLNEPETKGAARARYLEVKVSMINVINRIIWQSGLNATSDDLSLVLSSVEEITKPQKQNEKVKNNGTGERDSSNAT